MNASMEALHVGGFMETPSMDSLRTLLLLHHYYTRQDSSSSGFILNSALEVALVRRLSQLSMKNRSTHSFNLTVPWPSELYEPNRDPSSSSSARFGYIEAEERRRLWTLVTSSDWLENHGRTYHCSPSQADTLVSLIKPHLAKPTTPQPQTDPSSYQLPSNASDGDITSSGIIARPLTYPTPLLHLILKAQIATFARTITDRIYSIQFPPSWATVLELNAEFQRLENSLPQCLVFEWSNGAVKPFEEATKPMDHAKILVHLLLRQQCIRLHRPFLTRGFADHRFSFAREKVTWAARYTLAIHKGLGDDYRATRSWTLVVHALNALIILAIDLYLEPSNGKYSQVHRADIGASLKLLEARANKSAMVRETLRVVGVLLRRSSVSLSDKKRTHDDFLNGGGYGGVGGDSASSENPSDLSYILSGQANPAGFRPLSSDPSSSSHHLDTILRPFEPNSPFSRPLPITMSMDPFTSLNLPTALPSADIEWTQLWKNLRRYKSFYALPDEAECGEPRTEFWIGGMLSACLAREVKAEHYFLHQNQVTDMQTELEVLNAGLEDRNLQVTEALAAREFAEVESRTARTCLRELESDKAVQDLRIASLQAEVVILTEENSKLEDDLESVRQELSDALVRTVQAREKRHEQQSKALFAAVERLEAAEALRVFQAGESDTESIIHKRFEEIPEDEEEDDESTSNTTGHGAEGETSTRPNTTVDEYDVIDLRNELSTPSEVAAPIQSKLKAKLQAFVNTGRNRSHTSAAAPSSLSVKLFAVKELEDDLAEFRLLLGRLCDDFSMTDPAKLKRLQRIQSQMDEVTSNSLAKEEWKRLMLSFGVIH
ncbi:hypothetical protein P7C70_g2040, partial [Phenoliferia sp. Uapishka_3]